VKRSLFWPSVWAALGFLLLLGLGFWQLERLGWKEALIAQRTSALDAEPVAPPENLEDARALEFHPIHVSGHFLNDDEMPVSAISKRGEAGFHILTPFQLENGETLLIDRGFVPVSFKSPETRQAGLIEGETTVTGLLRVPSPPGPFVPANDPARNTWFSVDIPAMAKAQGIENALPFYLDADAAPVPGGYPVGAQTEIDLPNNHLQYAVTWFALAAGLVGVYILFLRRRLKGA
jgi:surfeit locus 1 family protein